MNENIVTMVILVLSFVGWIIWKTKKNQSIRYHGRKNAIWRIEVVVDSA